MSCVECMQGRLLLLAGLVACVLRVLISIASVLPVHGVSVWVYVRTTRTGSRES